MQFGEYVRVLCLHVNEIHLHAYSNKFIVIHNTVDLY